MTGSEPPADAAHGADAMQAARDLWRVLLTVAGVALLVRAVFFLAILHELPFYRTTYPGYDQHGYNLWAQQIAAGDWLSREQGVFFYAPLYPYVLAAVYVVAGPGNVVAAIVVNGLIGTVGAVCAAGLGTRLFGRWGGLAAGLFMALSGAQLSVEAMPLVDSLLPVLCLGCLWLFVWYRDRDRSGRPVPLWAWALPGLLMGVVAVGRATNLLVAAALCALLASKARLGRLRRPVLAAVVMGAGVWVFAGLPILRNGLMYGRWTTTLNGPVTFYIGNAPGASGVFLHPPGFAEPYERLGNLGHPPSAWLRLLRDELDANPGALRTALLRKTLLFLNSWDAPDNGNYYFVRRYVWAARLLTVGPLLLYALGFTGVVLTTRQWRRLLPLYVFGATFAFTIILVLVTGRYKLPFLALLAVFGGGAVGAVVDGLKERCPKRVVAAGLLAAVGVAAFWPRGPVGLRDTWTVFRPGDFLTHSAVLARCDRKPEAVRMLEDGRGVFPLVPQFPERLASFYLGEGQPERALEVTEAALSGNVSSQRILERRLLALAAVGRHSEARAAVAELLARYPDSSVGLRFVQSLPGGDAPTPSSWHSETSRPSVEDADGVF